MLSIVLIVLCGVFVGIFITSLSNYLENRRLVNKVREAGQIILHEAKDKEELLLQKIDEKFKAKRDEIIVPFQKEIEERKKNLKELQSHVDKKAYQNKLAFEKKKPEVKKIKKELDILKNLQKSTSQKYEKTQDILQTQQKQLIEALTKSSQIDDKKIKDELKKKFEDNVYKKSFESSQKKLKLLKENLKREALTVLHSALNRFQIAYCPERGIPPVSFKSKKQMEKVFGLNRTYLSSLEKECGVDFVIHDEDLQVSVYGIDPVRRELGHLALKSLLKSRYINTKKIKIIIKKAKQKLFNQIKKDGNRICSQLGIKNIPDAVKNMMGSLRYRYSFAQNQHFHCEEVGWLCGLLNSEMNLPLKKGQRAGLFHDIGKAMDHSIEGNHAVIGADFISQHGESEDVVHAVRAHHHDEVPSTPLAYLVISADAISGSRPGARRFTEDSYSQKLASLERIIDSFQNIEQAYIMSAGREMRIIVDDKKVSDKEALDLSRSITKKIEQECSYPGLIKVTVVRPSMVSTKAK